MVKPAGPYLDILRDIRETVLFLSPPVRFPENMRRYTQQQKEWRSRTLPDESLWQ